MKIIVFIISAYFFTDTIGYGIYEKKQNNNKIGAIAIFAIAILSLFLPNIFIWFR